METFNDKYPWSAMCISLLFTIDNDYSNHGFTYTIKTIFSITKLELFRYFYTHWKWFRRWAIKKFSKTLSPAFVFIFNQLLFGKNIDYEDILLREKYIEQYAKDNKLSEEDTILIKEAIADLVKEAIEKKSKETNTENKL